MSDATRLAQHARLRLVRTYIDRHYALPISIERMSQEAAFSPYHFIRLFQGLYRQTPHQYLVQRRVQKAKELLRATDLPVTEICAAVGFESLGSFSALFRRQVGLSPSAYRERAAASSADQATPPIPLCYQLKHATDLLPDA